MPQCLCGLKMILNEKLQTLRQTPLNTKPLQLDLIESQTRVINSVYLMKQAEADILVIMRKLVE